MQENNALSLHISKGEPSVFATVVDWLLSGNLECHNSHESVDSNEGHHVLHWYKVHTFAERYHSEKLCNAAIHRARLCIQLSRSLPNSAEIQSMFNHSPANQCFQNLIVTEVVNTFFALSMDDVRKGMPEMIETISSHPAFQSLFLIAVKARYQARTAGPTNVQRKRKMDSSDAAVPPSSAHSSQQTVIDLTSD
jgi:hypothetical protein